jgi:PLP dependent protein
MMAFDTLTFIMTMIQVNLQTVRHRVEQAAHAAGRDPATVQLLAVSKTWGSDAVREAAAAGQRAFGENYIQEAVDKMAAVADLADLALEWHCIGPVQANKTRLVATHFDWVHTVDRLKIAQRLSEQRPAHLPPLNVCVQVNVDGGAQKSGVAPHEALPLALAVSMLPGLRLRGVMVIPEPAIDFVAQYALFESAVAIFDQIIRAGLPLDTLSMGMSNDLEAAVRAGSTLVRVGTAIFGGRV